MAIEPKSSARRIRGRSRQRLAVDLRTQGLTFEAIGRQLGISTQAAHATVSRALSRILVDTNEAAEQLRVLELRRLDAMLAAVWAKVEQGDVSAINVALRIGERRAKLSGLDSVKDEGVHRPLTLPDIFAVAHGPGWRPTVEPTHYDDDILARVRRVPATEDEH